MEPVITFVTNPHNQDLLATAGILIASELHGWGKGGSLFQTALGYLARLCTRFSTPNHQAAVAEILQAQGVKDLAEPAQAPTPPPSA